MKRVWIDHEPSSSNIDISAKSGRIEQIILPILPLAKFDGKFPFYRQPMEIGHFSLDSERVFHSDNRQLRYLREEYIKTTENDGPRIGNLGTSVSVFRPLNKLDLGVGYSEYVCKNEETQERLDHLLKWIKQNGSKFRLKTADGCEVSSRRTESESLNTDFISWRGHFTKFLCTPYETKEPWQMAACLYKKAIFISEVMTEHKRQQEKNRTERQKEMCYWGYKFEDYMTKITTNGDKETLVLQGGSKNIVNSNEAFCTVIRSRLTNHSVVLGAEVDCRSHEKKTPPLNYFELKTSRQISSSRQRESFSRFKLLKFWAQSFLAGIPKVICGFRDDNGIVNNIQVLPTLEIPKLAATHGATWNSTVCMNFCNVLLNWMKSIVTVEDPSTVYMFHFREPFECIEYEVHTDGQERFLPEWFTSLGPQDVN